MKNIFLVLSIIFTHQTFGTKDVSKQYYILFEDSMNYKSENKLIDEINTKNISLRNLRNSFPFFSISIEKQNKESILSWIYHFFIIVFASSQRSKIAKEVKEMMIDSADGFVRGVKKLLILNHDTFSDKDKKWINDAQLWIQAYENLEVQNVN